MSWTSWVFHHIGSFPVISSYEYRGAFPAVIVSYGFGSLRSIWMKYGLLSSVAVSSVPSYCCPFINISLLMVTS